MRHDPNLTDAGTVKNATVAATEIGMAHFAGSGPEGKRCKDCAHLAQVNRKQICQKFGSLTGDRNKGLTGNASACRWFEARP